MVKAGRADLWTIRMDGRFAGFAATVNGPQVVLLDYLAVKKHFRGRGVGTGAMGLLNESYRDRGFFVEIESTFADAPNQQEREKRKQFYVNCGMEPMGTDVDVFGVRMELLGTRCRMDFESYRNFYRDNYSPWAAEHIREVEPCTGI
jgi:GNAT superfamily N-acetyltransferase